MFSIVLQQSLWLKTPDVFYSWNHSNMQQLKMDTCSSDKCVEKVIIYYSYMKSWRRVYGLVEIISLLCSLQVVSNLSPREYRGEQQWIIELFSVLYSLFHVDD